MSTQPTPGAHPFKPGRYYKRMHEGKSVMRSYEDIRRDDEAIEPSSAVCCLTTLTAICDELFDAAAFGRSASSDTIIRIIQGTNLEDAREALASAWDEGFLDGTRQDAEGEDGPRFANPYREPTA